MDYPGLQRELARLARDVNALAAIGGALRLLDASPDEGRTMLDVLINALLPEGTLASLSTEQRRAAIALIRLHFIEATDLLDNPSRAPGWFHTDAEVLEATGQASRENMRTLEALAAHRPGLRRALTGRMLDVGTGTAAIAIEAASRFSALQVVGIDIWEPALELARANVARSACAPRIALRHQNVVDVPASESFSLVWLPTPFLSEEIARLALARIHRVLQPGGYLVAGLYALPPDRVDACFASLRITRCGGHIWSPEEMETALRQHGFADVETSISTPVVIHVLARKPEPAQ